MQGARELRLHKPCSVASTCVCSVAKLCLTLCEPMDCSSPDSVLGFLQARILEWVAVSFSRRSSWPGGWTCISCIGRWILYRWATWEAHKHVRVCVKKYIYKFKKANMSWSPPPSLPFGPPLISLVRYPYTWIPCPALYLFLRCFLPSGRASRSYWKGETPLTFQAPHGKEFSLLQRFVHIFLQHISDLTPVLAFPMPQW